MPVKPMYSGMQSVPRIHSSGTKGGRVYQQIIHNNGSGNILFSSGTMAIGPQFGGQQQQPAA